MLDEVEKFIKQIRDSFKGSEYVYQNGSCYKFFTILKMIFKEVEPYYNNRHVVSKIGDNFYDITGKVTGEFVPYAQNISLENNKFDLFDVGIECANCGDYNFHHDVFIHKEYKEALDKTAIVSKSDLYGNITYVNDNFIKVSGYTREELIGKPHSIVRHPETPKYIFEDMWNTISEEKLPWKGKITNRSKTGKAYIVDATIIPQFNQENKLIGYIGIRYDITELEKQKDLNQTIIDAQKDIILIGHRFNGILAANKAFFKILNFTSLTHFRLKHRTIYDLITNIHEIDKKHIVKLKALKDVDIGEVKIKDKTFNLSLKTISDEQYLITLNDVTEMTSLIDQAQNESYMKSNFLATMSHEIRTPLNGIIPYIDILLDTKLTKEQKEYLDVIQSSSKSLLRIINDILDFSKIESGKLEIENIEFEPLKEIESVVELYAAKTSEKHIRFCSFIDPKLPMYLIGDALRIKQIINNLLSNAIKFTNVGGEIKFIFEVRNIHEDNVMIDVVVQDNGIGISKDNQKLMFKPFSQEHGAISRNFGGTGLGLSISQTLADLMGTEIKLKSEINEGSTFYFTLNLKQVEVCNINKCKNDTHRNIAIAVTKEEMSNCALILAKYFDRFGFDYYFIENFESYKIGSPLFVITTGEDTIPWINKTNFKNERVIAIIPSKELNSNNFYHTNVISMPLNASKIYDSIVEEYKEFRPKERKKENLKLYDAKVLVAEDNMTNQKIVGALLKKHKIKTVFAEDGLEAITKYSNAKRKFDLVLMDIHMPKMDGIEATLEIRKYEELNHLEQTPIVALSADAIKTHQQKFLTAGMNDFLSKPIEIDIFVLMLNKYLSHTYYNANEGAALCEVQKNSNSLETKIKAIMNALGLDEETSKMLFDDFMRNWLNIEKQFEIAIKELNYQKIASLAHQIKGASASLKLNDVYEVSKELELSAKEKGSILAQNYYKNEKQKISNMLKNI